MKLERLEIKKYDYLDCDSLDGLTLDDFISYFVKLRGKYGGNAIVGVDLDSSIDITYTVGMESDEEYYARLKSTRDYYELYLKNQEKTKENYLKNQEKEKEHYKKTIEDINKILPENA